MLAHTDFLGDLLCLSAAGSDAALGHANAILKIALDVHIFEIVGYAVVHPYRLEQGSGPVFVDSKASPLLDSRALQWCLLGRVSLHSQLRAEVRKRLLQLAATVGVHTVAARTARASGRARAKLYMMSGVADTRLGI